MKQRRPTLAGLLAPQDDAPVSPPAAQSSPAASPATSGALRAMGLTLKQMSEDAGRSRELQEKLTSGSHVVELAATSVDASFLMDRIPDHDDLAFDTLVESIREHGQEIPILVRPHPEVSGKYQIAYGRRRLRATAQLNIPVKALVRDLTDAELVIAQGKENLERQDLSFIERALFAHNLEERGFDRKTITAALCVDKASLSLLISVARSIPQSLIAAIGPAPKAGRPRWMELAQKLLGPDSLKTVETLVQETTFSAADSNTRFARVMKAVTPASTVHRDSTWSNKEGTKLVSIVRRSGRTSLHFDEKAEPDFSAFLVDRLDDLYAAFKRHE